MKPLLLDLFCCQGGAAKGYADAGFRVVGVDLVEQPRYPFEFIKGDALWMLEVLLGGDSICPSDTSRYWLRDIAAIHASPPCQAFTALRHMPTARAHPNLIPKTRQLLRETQLPYVIENVPGAPLEATLLLCGTMFGLQTPCGAELRRHRLFETNWMCMSGLHCAHNGERTLAVVGEGSPVGGTRKVVSIAGGHARDRAMGMERQRQKARVISVTGDSPSDCQRDYMRRRDRDYTVTAAHVVNTGRARVITVTGSTAQQNVERNVKRETFSVEDARAAMGIDWMGMKGLSQAIPPAYTAFIGRQLMAQIGGQS